MDNNIRPYRVEVPEALIDFLLSTEKTTFSLKDIEETGLSHFFSRIESFIEGKEILESEVVKLVNTPQLSMQSALFAGFTSGPNENKFTLDASEKARSSGIEPNENGVYETPEAELNRAMLTAMYRYCGHEVDVSFSKRGLIDGHYQTDHGKFFQLVVPKRDEQGKHITRKVIDEETGKEREENVWVMGKILLLLPKMRHEDRQKEIDHYAQYVDHGSCEVIQMENIMEFGDTRFCLTNDENGHVVLIALAGIAESKDMGYGEDGKKQEVIGRSTQEGHDEFFGYLKKKLFNNEFAKNLFNLTCKLLQPFYHKDTTGLVSNGGIFTTNRAAFSEETWQDLEETFGKGLYEFALKDIGERFGGNATVYGNNIFISDEISEEAAERYAELGFNVFLSPIPYTKASGGGQRCMTETKLRIPVGAPLDITPDLSKKGKIYKGEIVNYKTGEMRLLVRNYEKGSFNSKSGWDVVEENFQKRAPEFQEFYKDRFESVRGKGGVAMAL